MGSGFGPGGSGSLAILSNLGITKAIRTQATNIQTTILTRPFIFVGEARRVGVCNVYVPWRPFGTVENYGQQQTFLLSVE